MPTGLLVSEGSTPPPIRPAASLVVFRNGQPAPELLMVRRSRSLVFGSGQMVFPGGRVDDADREMAADHTGDIDWNAARIGAIRETLEETGLLIAVSRKVDAGEAGDMRRALLGGTSFGDALAKADLSLQLDRLVPFARWQPPLTVARRFDTRFFVTDVGTGDFDLVADGSESTELAWVSPRDMLNRHDRGQEPLMFPTRANLMQLARYPDFAAAQADSLSREIGVIDAVFEDRPDGRFLTIDARHGFPDVAMRAEDALRG